MSEAKPFCISKWEVWEAYKRVKANQGAAGVDEQTIADFERDLKGNLYKIWNRMQWGRRGSGAGAMTGSWIWTSRASSTTSRKTIRGWLQYYGRFYRSALYPPMRQLDRSLARWADRKYKKLRRHLRRATHWVARISRRDPKLWAHWQMGVRRGSLVGAV